MMFGQATATLLLGLTIGLSGCAFTVDRINLSYEQQGVSAPVAGASDVRLEVRVRDVRAQTDRVGSKTNGSGADMGAIVSNQNVADLFQGAISRELAARGYSIAAGRVVVDCEVTDFSNNWQIGFWSGSAVSSARLLVKIKDSHGNYIFTETVQGEGRKKGVQMATGANAKSALTRALQNCMKNLFAMPEFFAAIQRASDSYRSISQAEN